MAERIVHVQMAGMAVCGDGAKIKTILGSCVGVILHDRDRRQAALAHIMLPSRFGEDRVVAKYADTAIPALVEELRRRGSSKERLEAYLVGGARMFGDSEDRLISSVGEQNLRAASTILADLGIPVVYEDTGGSRGRSVLFDSSSAEIATRTFQPTFGARSEACTR